MQALSQGGYDTIDDLCIMPDEEIKELAVIQEDARTVKAVPKKSWKILLHEMMWRGDWTSQQKPVTTNDWLELMVDAFELFQENHLPGMIRGTKSGRRTSSGMDAQEGGIVTSSHVTEFARGHQRNPAAYTDFSDDNRHWFRIKRNWESNAANDGVRHLMDIKRVKPDENTEARRLYDAHNNNFYNVLQINVKGGREGASDSEEIPG